MHLLITAPSKFGKTTVIVGLQGYYMVANSIVFKISDDIIFGVLSYVWIANLVL